MSLYVCMYIRGAEMPFIFNSSPDIDLILYQLYFLCPFYFLMTSFDKLARIYRTIVSNYIFLRSSKLGLISNYIFLSI